MPPTPARYGPTDRYAPAPGGGMCLSVFALVRAGGRTLVARPAEHAGWERWMPSWKHNDPEEMDAIRRGWVLPAAYMDEGEDPTDTLRRIMRDMLGVRRYTASERPRVYTARTPSGWYPGNEHWDVAFVYDVRAAAPATAPPWFRELAWKRRGELRAKDFRWNADLAKALGVAR